MIHIETAAPMTDRWHRQEVHANLGPALDRADVLTREVAPTQVRLTVDAATLHALLVTGEAYETAGGEIIDRDQRWTLTTAE